jgi:hypothetical protein
MGPGSYIIYMTLFLVCHVDIVHMILNLNICITYFKMCTIYT